MADALAHGADPGWVNAAADNRTPLLQAVAAVTGVFLGGGVYPWVPVTPPPNLGVPPPPSLLPPLPPPQELPAGLRVPAAERSQRQPERQPRAGAAAPRHHAGTYWVRPSSVLGGGGVRGGTPTLPPIVSMVAAPNPTAAGEGS